MNYTVGYIMATAGTVLTAVWVLLYMKFSKSFDDVIPAIDKKKFMLGEVYFIGFGIISMLKLNLRTERGRKKEKKISEVYGERYASFYHYVILGGQITYALTFAPIGFFLGAISNDASISFLGIAAAAALVAYLDMSVNNAVTKRRDEILSDYPEMLSKLTLLVNAGLVLREAWAKVGETSDHPLYLEMRQATEDIRNGMADVDAIYNFAQRCALKEIRKFASVLTQNIKKGSSEMTASLRYMATESWEEKRHSVKRKGAAAGQKLLIPIMIMFVGVLLVIMVPIVMNMFG